MHIHHDGHVRGHDHGSHRCSFHHVHDDGLDFSNSRVSYRKMLEEELSSNVMLEILIPGVGSGPTLRYKEAVLYGKKLLTNNPQVSQLPCFDNSNIRYFNKPEDIDIDWIIDDISSSYQYDGEFSVDKFCDLLKEIVNEN